ncbi:hypothetical protein LCGC14_1696020 [marine sediment metagenome]|uniref:Uncharacterized protein n=1 Tax=marine sediment metagenome TaxID=412755 RepID=A0A0F9JZW2_9ZZZZ
MDSELPYLKIQFILFCKMTGYIKNFEFEKPPKKMTYLDDEPLELTEDFVFFHNKSKIRKSLNRLQYLFKSYTKNPLLALGIRDSLLKKEFTEKFLIILFTTPEVVEDTNRIIEKNSNITLIEGAYYLTTTSRFMLLLARDLKGINSGVNTMEEILKQILEDYFGKKNFEEFIKIRQFKLFN